MKNLARSVAAAAAIVLLAACGADNDSGGGADSSADHNQADVTFAQQMIPHHRQALMMSKLARTNDAGPEVAALAERIEQAQEPEIEKMTGWLEDWDEDGAGMGGMGGMDHGDDEADDGDMAGMMSPGDMRELATARGAEFDRVFLTQMIEHHEGAVEMAQKEQTEGKHAGTLELAEQIERSQTSEIAEMQKLLAG